MASGEDYGKLTVLPKAAQPEPPAPRRAPKGLLPSTWIGRTVKIDYAAADGINTTCKAVLLDLYPFGPVASVSGTKTAFSWDRLIAVALEPDL